MTIQDQIKEKAILRLHEFNPAKSRGRIKVEIEAVFDVLNREGLVIQINGEIEPLIKRSIKDS